MKRFNRVVFLLILTTLFLNQARAERVSVEDAAAIAARFTNTKLQTSGSNKAPRRAADMRFAHQMNAPKATEPAFYVFNQNDNSGYVIVSANSNTDEILGYSNEGSFDAATIPANMQYFLEYMAERVAVAQPATNKTRRAVRKAPAAHQAVNELLGNIKWNQGEPYNDLCPIDPVDNTRSATGCVATAAAQIMYYWRWPVTGEGSRKYTWKNEKGGTGTEEVNFGATTYDWANMKNKHSASDTEAQKKAIATLMYHVGVACKMSYGGDETGGSGAYTNDMRDGLVNYFRYKSSAEYVSNKTASQLATLFKKDLDAGRPILMGGVTPDNQSGHEFVCDGYDENDLFHINWGWGGMSNGYFTLTGLDPNQQGIGGSSSGEGFSKDIDCVLGLEPDKDPVNVTGVSVTPTSVTIKQRERYKLEAVITPSDASNKAVSWSSSDEKIAKVTASGIVIGKSEGTATITVTTNNGSKKATCAVTVTDEVMPATVLDVNAGGAYYDDYYDEPWTVDVYNANDAGSLPYVRFYPSTTSSTKIAGIYTLSGASGVVWNNPDDENEYVAFKSGQLAIECVGKKDGANGCNTYRVLANFICEDDAEYKLDATMEICAEDDSENAIELKDNVGDGKPIEITWKAQGDVYAENIAVSGKVTLPADNPGNCSEGKVFVGWCADENYDSDAAPTFITAGKYVSANATYYAVYATPAGGSTYTEYSTVCSKCSGALTGITINTDNVKKIFKEGETFSSAGLVVTANYEGCKSKSVTSKATLSSPDMNKLGKQTITITFEEKTASYEITINAREVFTVNFYCDGKKYDTQSVKDGLKATVPANPTAACSDFVFEGWFTEELAEDNTNKPAYVTDFTITKNQDFYAIFSKTEASGKPGTDYEKISTLSELADGNYVVAGNSAYAMKAELYSDYYLATTAVSPVDGVISNPAANIVWKITRAGNKVSFYNEKINQYAYLYQSGKFYDLGLRNSSYQFNATVSGGNWTFEASDLSGEYMVYYIYTKGGTAHEFAAKNNATETTIQLYKQGEGFVTYYSSKVACGTQKVAETLSDKPTAIKAIVNGQIVIIRGEAVYSITGERIR